jgi:hypothetical protein
MTRRTGSSITLAVVGRDKKFWLSLGLCVVLCRAVELIN